MTQSVERPVVAPPAAPYSVAVRRAAGICLVLAAVTNGLCSTSGTS